MDFDDYPRPSLAVDPAVLRIESGQLVTHLWRRSVEPNVGSWALPGVFVSPDETLEDAARRGVATKVGLEVSHLTQLFAWNRPGRDARGWVVTVAYFAIAKASTPRAEVASGTLHDEFVLKSLSSADDAVEVAVCDMSGNRVRLAFDHEEILGAVLERLRTEVWAGDVALRFLNSEFTLRELQSVYEAILGRSLNKDSFRRRIVQSQELVLPTGRLEENVSHRPAELYRSSGSTSPG